MQECELVELVYKIRHEKCEGQRFEVKSASNGCPKRLYDTLSSFANQNTGGTIVFGIDEESGFAVSGVYDVQDLQHRVAQQCAEMSPVVRALFTSAEIDGKMVVSAEIPPAEPAQRPVFYRGRGRLGGSFVRVGDADEPMTEFEIYSYEAYRRHEYADRRIIDTADTSLFDSDRLATYIRTIKTDRPNLSAIVPDAEIPAKMGLEKDGHPSIVGLMVFSVCPQIALPQLCITAVVVPGESIGVAGQDGVRFAENRQITGAIPEMLDGAEAFVSRNAARANAFTKDGKRIDRREYPMIAVREAILNALVHRDYSPFTESCPIRIEMYPDRLEITNKGGLYGAAPLSALGRIDIGKRNPLLVDTLEHIGKTENRNSGIATMREECARAGLPPPEFSVVHGEFKVVFRNSRPEDNVVFDRRKAEETILAFCQTPRSREELAAFTGRTQPYTMHYLVRPLLDAKKLAMTNPAMPKDPAQRFVRAPAALAG